MNGYICFFNNDRLELHAETSYAASLEAAAQFQAMPKNRRRKVKSHHVMVCLAEQDGQQVYTTAVD